MDAAKLGIYNNRGGLTHCRPVAAITDGDAEAIGTGGNQCCEGLRGRMCSVVAEGWEGGTRGPLHERPRVPQAFFATVVGRPDLQRNRIVCSLSHNFVRLLSDLGNGAQTWRY